MSTPITRAKAHEYLQAGFVGFLAEYRGMDCAAIPYVSKKTGKQAVMNKATHAVEVNGRPCVVGEILKDDVDVKAVKPAQTKGKMVLVELKGLDTQSGALNARGFIIPISD